MVTEYWQFNPDANRTEPVCPEGLACAALHGIKPNKDAWGTTDPPST